MKRLLATPTRIDLGGYLDRLREPVDVGEVLPKPGVNKPVELSSLRLSLGSPARSARPLDLQALDEEESVKSSMSPIETVQVTP